MSLIPKVEQHLTEVRSKRATAKAELDRVLAAAQRGKRDLTPAESDTFDRLVAEVRRYDDEADQAELRINELTVQEQREAAAARARVETGHTGLQRAYVNDAAVYHPGPGSPSFFRDLHAAQRGDWQAAERLARNNQAVGMRELRAGSTSAGAGGEFAPPDWLVDEFVALARPGRVTADRCHKDNLPSGVSSINLPRVATGTTTAVQASENTSVSDTDVTTDSVSSGITTIAGKQVISQQLIDQSGIPYDRVILEDLARDYAEQLDKQVLSGTGASGQLEGLLTLAGTNGVTYTSSSPAVTTTTAADSFLAQILGAVNDVYVGIFRAPDAIVMHPRRWSWVLNALDTTNRPLVTPDGPAFNQPAVSTAPTAQGAAGTLAGIPVYVDPNLPTNLGAGTNQDPVIVAKFDECFLWESELRAETFTAPYADSMGVLFRVYAYSAFIPGRRPKAISIINGTGLITPTL